MHLFGNTFLLALCGHAASTCDLSDGSCSASDITHEVSLLQSNMLVTAGKVRKSAEPESDEKDPEAMQNFPSTTYDRYPTIFRGLQELLSPKPATKGPIAWIKSVFHPAAAPGPLRLLSFGCSDGSECHSLRYYFGSALIDGVDIIKEQIAKNIERNIDPYVQFFDSVANLTKGSYDAILAMGVLTHEGKGTDKEHLEYERYLEAMNMLDGLLKPGGYLVIYNADYAFSEWPGQSGYQGMCGQDIYREEVLVTSVDVKYDRTKETSLRDMNRGACSIPDKYCIESGWVRKFDKNGDKVQSQDGRFGSKDDSPIQMSQGCKFAGTFFRKLSAPELAAKAAANNKAKGAKDKKTKDKEAAKDKKKKDED